MVILEDIAVSGEDRQSQLAREHKERQARRAEQASKAKRNTFIGAGTAVVVVVGGVIAASTLMGGEKEPVAAQTPVPSESASTPAAPDLTPSAKPGAATCEYRKDTTGSPTKFVGYPPKKPNLKLKTMTITTNHGDIVIDLMTPATPCTVNSLAFLAKKNFYDGTKCHRLATPENSGLGLLQCGDPQAKADGKNPTDGQGSSGYVFNDENLGGLSYRRGTVALAQASDAANQNGSQFWISYSDETAQLDSGPAYTPFGTVSKGMEIIDKIVAGGWITNEADITGDGGSHAPKIPVLIKDVELS
ncbi:peptidyl-prolyl cis-trans isomerase [Planomonospora parontospora subsp. parontospora]|uniref:Peptidyl-prolyl cis-trans isomerase n=2 Tax=Planomonospora parontospora TaxID=58119 RepID=A0AA37BM88_9ACTN|nr:peptidyl-prolyl cis-trans isomerase [Planomonospora parontospora]GII11187.1 peptidyl-prolyl cis-trans isomerase [Planomonospora parontospora subsp. parontospora]